MRRHNLPIVLSILTFFKSGMSVCARQKSNATSIGSRLRLPLLHCCYCDICFLNSNEGSRELTFPRKIFCSCKNNCRTHSNNSECFHWFSEKKVQCRKPISPLKNKVRDIQVIYRVSF